MQTSATNLHNERHLDSFLYSASTLRILLMQHGIKDNAANTAAVSSAHTFPTNLFCREKKQTWCSYVQGGEQSQTLQQPWTHSWLLHLINTLAVHLHPESLWTIILEKHRWRKVCHKNCWSHECHVSPRGRWTTELTKGGQAGGRSFRANWKMATFRTKELAEEERMLEKESRATEIKAEVNTVHLYGVTPWKYRYSIFRYHQEKKKPQPWWHKVSDQDRDIEYRAAQYWYIIQYAIILSHLFGINWRLPVFKLCLLCIRFSFFVF